MELFGQLCEKTTTKPASPNPFGLLGSARLQYLSRVSFSSELKCLHETLKSESALVRTVLHNGSISVSSTMRCSAVAVAAINNKTIRGPSVNNSSNSFHDSQACFPVAEKSSIKTTVSSGPGFFTTNSLRCTKSSLCSRLVIPVAILNACNIESPLSPTLPEKGTKNQRPTRLDFL